MQKLMMISKLISKSSIFGNIMTKFNCKRVLNHPSIVYSETNSYQKNSASFLPSAGISDFSKFTPIWTARVAMLKYLNRSQLLPKNCFLDLPINLKNLSMNLLFVNCSKHQKTSFYYSFWVEQCFVVFFVMYYFLKGTVFASGDSYLTQLLEENVDNGINSENLQSQGGENLQDGSTEANKDHISHSNIQNDQTLNLESGPRVECNAGHSDQLPTNPGESDSTCISKSAIPDVETNEPSIFAPVILEELQVSSPAELNDAQSLTHHHMVSQSAAVAVESSHLLLLRVSRALLVIMENYKSELEQILQLLQYNATLLRNSGGAAQHSQALQQVTDALTVARAREQCWEQQYKDGCLLMRVAHQTSASAQLCAHIAGAEQDALAVAAAVTALRPKIEQLQQEIRSLQRDVRAQHVEVIKSEEEGRLRAGPPGEASLS